MFPLLLPLFKLTIFDSRGGFDVKPPTEWGNQSWLQASGITVLSCKFQACVLCTELCGRNWHWNWQHRLPGRQLCCHVNFNKELRLLMKFYHSDCWVTVSRSFAHGFFFMSEGGELFCKTRQTGCTCLLKICNPLLQSQRYALAMVKDFTFGRITACCVITHSNSVMVVVTNIWEFIRCCNSSLVFHAFFFLFVFFNWAPGLIYLKDLVSCSLLTADITF